MKVLSFGVFDLFHYGHANFIKLASKIADDKIYIGLLGDNYTKKLKGHKPIMNLFERESVLEDNEYVRSVYMVEKYSDYKKIIEVIEPDLIIHGDDWYCPPSIEIAKKLGIDICFLPYTKEISSSEIKKRILRHNEI
jgi:cytidyltransferase-like protein